MIALSVLGASILGSAAAFSLHSGGRRRACDQSAADTVHADRGLIVFYLMFGMPLAPAVPQQLVSAHEQRGSDGSAAGQDGG
jgi:hypothetical protein